MCLKALHLKFLEAQENGARVAKTFGNKGFDWLIISSFNSLSQVRGLCSVELEDGHEYGWRERVVLAVPRRKEETKLLG
jgi:hypothetical protein